MRPIKNLALAHGPEATRGTTWGSASTRRRMHGSPTGGRKEGDDGEEDLMNGGAMCRPGKGGRGTEASDEEG